MNIHQKVVIFLEKTMKRYFQAMMLSRKIYENILKFNFLMREGGRRSFIDAKKDEVS